MNSSPTIQVQSRPGGSVRSNRHRSARRPRRALGAIGLAIGVAAATIGVGTSVGTAAPSQTQDQNRLGHDFVVTDDGTYIWFTDDRAVVTDRTLVAGFVQVDGTVGVSSVDLATGRRLSQDIPLKKWGTTGDDHAAPALLAMNNDRVGVFYTGHDWNISGKVIHWRVSSPGVPTRLADFSEEKSTVPTIDGTPVAATYSNAIQLSGEQDKIYNFFRLGGQNTFFLNYDSDGNLLTPEPVPILATPPGLWQRRPYVKYASNGVDRIDMVFTNGHPGGNNLNMYHAYYQGGNLYQSDGKLIGNVVDDGPFDMTQVTEIYNQQTVGDKYTPWNHDVKIGPNGNPVLVYSRQRDPYTLDYRYATYDPAAKAWVHIDVADAGDSMIPTAPIDPYDGSRAGGSQSDYAGGIVINPLNVNEVFISTTVNPITEATTDKFEIYRGELSNGSFTWTALTQNSPEDNYRPVVPPGASYDDQVVIWFSGKYESFVNDFRGDGADQHFYTGYDTRIVGRYLHRRVEQADDNYAIDVNGPNAITAEGHRPLEGSGEAPLATERASVALVNSDGARERAGRQGDVLQDFGFANGDLDVSIADLNPGYYDFSLTNYDTWNPQDVAVEFFPTGAAPVTVVPSHSQTDPGAVGFSVQIEPNTDYTLRLRRLGNRPTVLNSLEMTRVGDSAPPPTVSFEPGEPMTVKSGATITFDGSASVAADGQPLRYAWRSTGIPGIASDTATFTRQFDTAGRTGVELAVVDSQGRRATKHIDVWVEPDGAPPVASFEPGIEMNVIVGATLTFDGSASVDPDGGPLRYEWRSTGMNEVGSDTTTFTRTFRTPGRIGVELTVIDEEGQAAKQHVNIWVTTGP